MKLTSKLWTAALAVFFAVAPDAYAQQQVPSPAQAEALLKSRPDLAGQVRQRIATSGMTPEQLRARLSAEGYPQDFLDSYLPGTSGAAGPVSDDVISALRRLGITDANDASTLRTMLREDTIPKYVPVRVAEDSLLPAKADSAAYTVFGLDLFRNSSSRFVPTLDGPVGPDYRVGPGDELVLILTGDAELAQTLNVTREGFVLIPQVGQISVANLTMAELENLLFTRLARSYAGVRRGADAPTKFSISISRLRAIQVYVTGDVERPANYRVSSASTAMTAIYAAGGPTANGSMRSIAVRRAGTIVGRLDVYDYLLRGDDTNDIQLENGDIVFVEPHGSLVRVRGEVRRPATYEVRAGETLQDVISFTGGLRSTAARSRLTIGRVASSAAPSSAAFARSTVQVTLEGQTVPAFEVQNGDEIIVFPITDRVRNRVLVSGHVWTPGSQGLAPGGRLSDALRAAGGLRPDAYLGQVSVSRLRADSTRIALRTTLRDTSGTPVEDLVLQEDDEITVYSLTEFRSPRYVAIGGSVRKSGQYPWRDGMTLRDLVLEAGGLREGAYLTEAEIARLAADRSNRATATTVRVPLDSSYLGDYTPGQPYAAPPGAAGRAYRSTPEVLLQPYDNVLVMEQPDWVLPRAVVLSGEVRFPGRYTLVTKDERLSDVLRRAGGLTSEAAVDAAYFARAVAFTSFQADSAFRADSALKERQDLPIQRSRVGLDLARALRQVGSSDNLVLFDDDSLHVPVLRSTVEIRGAVNAPTTITAQGGARLEFYLRSAGGASLVGDERRAYVIQPNGQIQATRRFLWIIKSEPKPRPGASVVVPVRSTESRASERIAIASVIAQTIASLATVYAILR